MATEEKDIENSIELSHSKVNSNETLENDGIYEESTSLKRQSLDAPNRKTIRENKLLSLSNTLHNMPNTSLHRLKSTLTTPSNLISSRNGYNYNQIDNSNPANKETGRTIQNDVKSSIDIYDNEIENDLTNTDDNTFTKSNDSKTNEDLNNLNNTIKKGAYNSSDTLNSSIGYHTDDDYFDDLDDDKVRSWSSITSDNNEDKVKCNCYKWLKEYKKRLLCTTILITIVLIMNFFVAKSNMNIVTIYIEFILMVLILWNVVSILWGLISYLLFICTARHWCRHKHFDVERFIFYIHHSGTYISYSILSTILYGLFAYLQSHQPKELSRFSAIIENADPSKVEFIERVFLCSLVLWYGLFIKTIIIRWVCLTYYLSSHLIKIKKFKKYESWLKILLKNRHIFSIKVKKFLDLNELHNHDNHATFGEHSNKTIAFRLSVLADQTEFDLTSDHNNPNKLKISNNMNKIDEVYNEFDDNNSSIHDSINNKLVNTLTSGTMFNISSSKKYSHNTQTCLLWLYNRSTQKVTIIDKNELHKVCKKFAKYIVAVVAKKRFDAKTPRVDDNCNRPTFTELRTMFARYSRSVSENNINGGEIIDTRSNTTLSVSKTQAPPARLTRSSMTVSGEFIQHGEFIRCFAKLNKTRQGSEAWKEINMSDKLLTKKELQRWLYQYFHGLIYLKQTLNSYQEILDNLDMSTNIIAIFVLFFIFLLIFEFNFIDSVSIYFSMIAIFAVFGQNVFTQFFDAIYFIFVLSPFEIGDVVLIDNKRYTVNKIHIMSSEMITAVANGNTIVIKNNAKLLNKDINNLSKSQSPYHNITFYISQLTTISQLNTLKLKIDTYIRAKMKNDINDVWFILDGVDKECRMKISLFLGSIYPFSDSALMWKQYHLVNLEIRKIINQMGISYKRFSNQDVQLSALIEDDSKQMHKKYK